eukprot:gene7553-15484_t
MLSPRQTIGNHSKSVVSLKFSKDDRMLATASADKTAQIINSTTGIREATLHGHNEGLNDIIWLDHLGQYVATASDDKTIRIWDIEKEMCISVLTGHQHFTYSLAIHPTQNILLSGSYDETIRTWDIRSRNHCIYSIRAHASPVVALDINGNGDEFISGGTNGVIRVWDMCNGYCKKTVAVTNSPAISSLRYSPNGKYVLCSTLDSTHRILDIDSDSSNAINAQPSVLCEYSSHKNENFSINSLFFQYESKQYVMSGSEDNHIYIWDLKNSETVQKIAAHSDVVTAVAWNKTNGQIASASLDNDVKSWNIGNNL